MKTLGSVIGFVSIFVYACGFISMLIGDYEWGIFLVLAAIWVKMKSD